MQNTPLNLTSMAILHFVEKIQNSIDQREQVIGVFLDLPKAFDTVDHNIVVGPQT